jgi:adenylate cyclase
VFGYLGEDIDAAIELADPALTLNPSFAHGWYLSGWLRLWAWQPELAISHFETSLRLSPNARRATTCRSASAIFLPDNLTPPWQSASVAAREFWLATHIPFLSGLLCAYGAAERRESLIVRKDATQWRNPEYRKLYLSGLRLAAGEAT